MKKSKTKSNLKEVMNSLYGQYVHLPEGTEKNIAWAKHHNYRIKLTGRISLKSK
jgi:hypothetical protein